MLREHARLRCGSNLLTLIIGEIGEEVQHVAMIRG
jgi:hypothetical protein